MRPGVEVNKIQQSMYNIYKNEGKNNDASELRIIDYRNGKYQGTTTGPKMTRQGVGMVLDHNYLLAIAAWKEGCADGPVITIFPDCTIFYGFLKGKLPVGIGCYQVGGKLQIYSLIGSGDEDQFVVDDVTSKNMILFAVSKKIVQKLYEEPVAFEQVLIETTKLMVKREAVYANAEEKWEIIEGFFKTVYLSELKSFKEFVKHYFQTQVKPSQPKLEIVQTKEEVQFNYQNSSILCKIAHNSENDADFRVKLLGYYNHSEHQFQISKKMASKSDTVEENIENFRSEYPFSKRTAVCMRHAQSYYRKSLNFVNDFLEIDYLYRIRFIYHSIETSIGEFSINRNAQKQLEDMRPSPEKPRPEREGRARPPQSYEETVSKENLSKAKDDIYKAVKSRSQSRVKSTSNSHLRYQAPQRFEISRITDPPYRPKQYAEPRPRQEAHVPTPSPGKRSYVYLEQPNDRIRTFKNSPNKYEYTKALEGRREAKGSEGKLSKFKYLDESAKARKAENLASLTSYYEEIENELRKETPKAAQRKHRNIDGAAINNRYAAQNGGKDKFQAAQEQTEKPPLGPRRVFKYGWE